MRSRHVIGGMMGVPLLASALCSVAPAAVASTTPASVAESCAVGSMNTCYWSGGNFTGTFEGHTSRPGYCFTFYTIPYAYSVSNPSDYRLDLFSDTACNDLVSWMLPDSSWGEFHVAIRSFSLGPCCVVRSAGGHSKVSRKEGVAGGAEEATRANRGQQAGLRSGPVA